MTLSPHWKEEEDEAIEIPKDNIVDDEPNWKVVGSPSRRESFSVRVLDVQSLPTSTTVSKPEFARRGSVSSEKQWGSFGGFQWEGPSIFEEEMIAAPRTPLPPNIPDHQFYDPTAILSVPMLPSVSLEPIYRQQRSFSFSMGQDPTFFGYDDYSNNRLAPTMEEEEEDQFDDAYLRARSQSSNATFGGFWSNNRRSSLGFIPSSPFIPAENHKDILSQRRMSQPLNNVAEYSFPEIIPNGGPSNSNHSTFLPSISSSSLQQRLENAHIYTSTSASIISTREHQAIPETSLSTGNTPSSPQQLKLQQEVNSTGKGMLLQILPPHIPLFMVEFKSGRTDFYYVSDPMLHLRVGDLVIVEADRGKDLGKVATDILTVDQVVLLQKQQNNSNCNRLVIDEEDTTKKISNNDSHVKRIYRQASPDEVGLLLIKEQDEQRALTVCLQKIKNRKLLMEVVDAEFQWDRRKLTFYFIAERRIDFRELVRELFKIYKTRIWMCAVNPTLPGRSVTTTTTSASS